MPCIFASAHTDTISQANLDIQYTVGIASGVPVAFISVGEENNDFYSSYDHSTDVAMPMWEQPSASQ